MLLNIWSPCYYVSFFFFSLLLFFMMHAPGSSKIYHVHSTEVASQAPANHRAVSLMCPCSFSLMISHTSVEKLLPPESPSPVGISLNRFPFYRLHFRTFLLFLFPFVLLILAHTLNLRNITLSFKTKILSALFWVSTFSLNHWFELSIRHALTLLIKI